MVESLTDLDAIEQRHRRDPQFTNAVCVECSAPWPCDASVLVSELREARAALREAEQALNYCSRPTGMEKRPIPEYTLDGSIYTAKTAHAKVVAALGAAPSPEPRPEDVGCKYGDPYCPCQDGDACDH